MKCKFCNKKCLAFSRDPSEIKKHLLIDSTTIHELIVFFEYLTPNTTSNLSYVVDADASDIILNEMLKNFREGKDYLFCSKLSNDDLESFSLSESNVYSSCKRFVSSVCSTDKKNKMTSLFRHMRNSIAHGRYSIIKCGSYYKIFFEDSNKDKRITFRMVVNHSILRKWKDIICEYSQ